MDYKQQSNQGCLIVSLMYLFGVTPTRQKEEALLSAGLFRLRENYTLGCLQAFLDKYPQHSATIYVDNSYYAGMLNDWVNHPRISMIHRKNDARLLDELEAPFIVYVDTNITEGWLHLPHFMLVVGKTEHFFRVFDPWEGKTIRMSKDKLLHGIKLLRDHVRVCPFVIVAGIANKT